MADPVLLRTSERTSFKECRQKWWWGYEERLVKVGPPSTALRFGNLVHDALERYYRPGRKRGPHPARTYVKLYRSQLADGMPEMSIRNNDDEDSEKWLDPIEFGVAILENYIAVYGKDDRYEIVQPEQSFQLDVMHPRTGKYMFTYVSTMDAVIIDLESKKMGLFEHKTSSNLQPFGAPLTLDEQSSAYWTFGTMWLQATGKLKPGQDLDFMLYNFIRKQMPDTRPEDDQGRKLNKPKKDALRAKADELGLETKKGATIESLTEMLRKEGVQVELLGEVSQKQPAPLLRRETVMRGPHERVETFRRALNEFREMEMVRQGRLAVYKNPGKHCAFCPFRDMCEVHETGSDWEAMRDSLFTTWDPYAEHEEGMMEE